jgi:hypothetical protein
MIKGALACLGAREGASGEESSARLYKASLSQGGGLVSAELMLPQTRCGGCQRFGYVQTDLEGRYWFGVSLALVDEGVLFLRNLSVNVTLPSNMRTSMDRALGRYGRCYRKPSHIYGIAIDR